MSPRRMDISSLLRDPSPSPRTDRPRTIDALLHHDHDHDHDHPRSPPSLFPTTPRHAPHPHPPFLGLDALVHVASEERRRISASSSLPLTTHVDRDRLAEQDHPAPLVHDHDRLSRLHTYPPPLHRRLDLSPPSRPHKRVREAGPPSPPRSPSPEPRFPPLTSPSTCHRPSASPTNNYPTLRRQPTHSAPAPQLASPVNDTRTGPHPPSLSLQRTPPFSHPLHSFQLPIHSPSHTNPHRLSPQHILSQLHSSPIQPRPLISPSAEADAMSLRYGYGPRMAGGIEVLSHDPSPTRELPRPDPSNFRGPGRDMSTERFVSESRVDHARHEPPQLSPLSRRVFSPDSDRHQVKAPHQVDGQDCVSLRERVRSHPPHSPPVGAMTDNGKYVAIPAKESALPAQLPLERHPIRVWEEQPAPREISRPVSLVHMPDIIFGPAEAHTWSKASQDVHSERPAEDGRRIEPWHRIAEDVSATRKEPSRPRAPAIESLVSDPQTPSEGTRLGPPPLLPTPTQPRSSVQSEPQPSVPQASFQNSSTSAPVLHLHLVDVETQSKLQPERSSTRIDSNTSVPFTSSDLTATEPLLDKAELMPVPVDMDCIPTVNPLLRRPSPEPNQPVLTRERETFESSARSTHANASQSTSRSPSQQPLPTLSSAKDDRDAPPEDIVNSPPARPESQSPEPEYTSIREPLVLDQTLMDVDDELLSLVEDRPVHAVAAMPKAQIESRLPLRASVGLDTGPGSETPGGLSLASSSQSAPNGSLMTDEEKDRASIPPPAARSKKAEKEKTIPAAGAATGSKKKKDGTSKPAAKPKQPPKPRTKPIPKSKVRPNVVDVSLKGSISRGVVNVTARSRSTSVIPTTVDEVVLEPEADESDKEDDKLYCVCKTRYDEDRMMIACDRCDEWFHTLCVNMPDLEIDLVDQFICPPCVQKHPHLRTTWKRRCLFGLQHEHPSSLQACHKPSRGAFSKYCSDECGINYMRTRIVQWEKSGGARGLLWESVKNTTKREGVVVRAETNLASSPRMMHVDSNNLERKPFDSAQKRRAEREVARLNTRLEEVVKERESMKCVLDMVMWREKVVDLASERAGKVEECGWDQRLCFGKEEWADFGPEVLESYEEERVKVESGDDGMSVDAVSVVHGEWWCTGKKKCERHAGWQKLRAAEVSFDKETKEGILLKLTTREREIRKRIEDILYPQSTGSLQSPPTEAQVNGSQKPRSAAMCQKV